MLVKNTEHIKLSICEAEFAVHGTDHPNPNKAWGNLEESYHLGHAPHSFISVKTMTGRSVDVMKLSKEQKRKEMSGPICHRRTVVIELFLPMSTTTPPEPHTSGRPGIDDFEVATSLQFRPACLF